MQGSLADLRRRAKPGAKVTLSYLILRETNFSYQEFVDIVQEGIAAIADEVCRNPELAQSKSEDELTIQIVQALNLLGFTAYHDAKIGGHCDITVEEQSLGYLWIAEAKLDNDNSWLMDGYDQLVHRYTTGMVNQTVGCLLIYAKKRQALKSLTGWKDYLKSKGVVSSLSDCRSSPLAFWTTEKHPRSGLIFSARHLALPLFFSPKK